MRRKSRDCGISADTTRCLWCTGEPYDGPCNNKIKEAKVSSWPGGLIDLSVD